MTHAHQRRDWIIAGTLAIIAALIFEVIGCGSPPTTPTGNAGGTGPWDTPATTPAAYLTNTCDLSGTVNGYDLQVKITLTNNQESPVYVSGVTYTLYDDAGDIIDVQDNGGRFPGRTTGTTVQELAVPPDSWVSYAQGYYLSPDRPVPASCTVTDWQGGYQP